jgi:catalase
LRQAVQKEGAKVKNVAPHVGGAKTGDGKLLEADMQLAGAPSIFFDAVTVIVSEPAPVSSHAKPPHSTSYLMRSITSR